MKQRAILHHIVFVLAYRILLVMVLFSFCRIGFYLFNHSMFPGISFNQFLRIMKGGILFDLSGVLYINLLIIVLHIIPFDIRYNKHYQALVKYLFFILNGLGLIINCTDFIYYRFIEKRATAEVFATFSNEQNTKFLAFRFMWDYWPVTVLFVFMMIFLIFLFNFLKPVKPVHHGKISYLILDVAILFFISPLVYAGLMGGAKDSTETTTISRAIRYVDNPRDVALVLNTPVSLIKSWNKETLERINYLPEAELVKYYNPHYSSAQPKVFKNYNVIIIILESFSREYIGALNRDLDDGKYSGYTPFIDSLISVSKTFSVSLANGRKSIDGIPSVLASIPAFETPYIISPYSNNRIDGMASLLSQKGYYSAFFHGAPNGSMGFDSFTRMAGFRDYFGKDEYPNNGDFDGVWGIWDEPFFQFFNQKLSGFQQPFFASIFSVSSHHPFQVPGKYKGKFKKGPVPILETIGYTDHSLKEFFESAEKEPWFDNTLFVLTADHTNELFHDSYQNNLGFYSIPIIFYKRGSDLRGIEDKIAQQTDILPTVMNYLGFDKDYVAFGNDLFNDEKDHFAFNSSGSIMQIYKDHYLLQMLGGKSIGLFDYKQDRLITKNLLGKFPGIQDSLELKLKAIIQSYNNRLIDNNMAVK
jgi:phosphoglycerol transferase MdoB-like AlkP superfamily enzyme